MTKYTLKVSKLGIFVEGRAVVEDFSFELGVGEVLVIMGANGSGKSSLVNAIMGNSRYRIDDKVSEISFKGKNLLPLGVDERARIGIYTAWQNPIALPGVSVFSMCKAAYLASGKTINNLIKFKQTMESLAVKVGLTKEHVSREVNVGFSGGERKRFELLQLLLLRPKLAILDEVDSGMDHEGVILLAEIVKELKSEGCSFVVITHNKKLLDSLGVDRILEMKHGRLSARV